MLNTKERKRILLDNIFGVDIDFQAVEVTKLSLLLKVLEGETTESVSALSLLFHERALPDLGDNIKCGNSLIEHNIYNVDAAKNLPSDDKERINPLDWKAEFPRVFQQGGFDAVIGNPPYGATLGSADVSYLRSKYQTATSELDTYTLFMELALSLVRKGGLVSMIVPTGWYSGARFGPTRRFVATVADPISFVNLPYDIFKAWVDTTIFVMRRRSEPTDWPRTASCQVQLLTFPKKQRITAASDFEAGWRTTDFIEWFTSGSDEFLTYADTASATIMRKLQEQSNPLGSYADVQRGITPFQLTPKATHKTSRRAFNGTVRRYTLDMGEAAFVRFDQTLAEPKPERYFRGPRLLLRELISRQFRLQAVKTSAEFVTNKSMQSILPIAGGAELSYLLGILNSRLMSWYFLNRSNIAQRDDFPKIVLKETRDLPIRAVDLSRPREKTRHDKVVSVVDHMLLLQSSVAKARTPHEKESIAREIAATDQRIDALVYELYGLSDAEIGLVEETTG
jgi:hypothetical protein